jgi:hypothetical protein
VPVCAAGRDRVSDEGCATVRGEACLAVSLVPLFKSFWDRPRPNPVCIWVACVDGYMKDSGVRTRAISTASAV